MADTSTFEEGLTVLKQELILLEQPLSGYTSYSPKVDGPDFELIKTM